MKKLLVTAAAITALAIPSAALAGNGQADGQCVKTGVQLLGGKGLGVISAAATGGVILGVNAVPIVIKDHAFNNADVTETLLGTTICE